MWQVKCYEKRYNPIKLPWLGDDHKGKWLRKHANDPRCKSILYNLKPIPYDNKQLAWLVSTLINNIIWVYLYDWNI